MPKILEIMQNGYAGGPFWVSWLDVTDFSDEDVSKIIVCNTDPDKGQWCQIAKEEPNEHLL